MSLRIALISDHSAVGLKNALATWLATQGHTVLDLGPADATTVDYPDQAGVLVDVIRRGEADRGILLCGTGIGMSMAANRHPGIRCALVSEPLSAALTRQHNDANVLALGARLIGEEMAKACLAAFLATPFEGGRHTPRVLKLTPDYQEQPA